MSWGEQSCYWYGRFEDPKRKCTPSRSTCNPRCEHYREDFLISEEMTKDVYRANGAASVVPEDAVQTEEDRHFMPGFDSAWGGMKRGLLPEREIGPHRCTDKKKKAKRRATKAARRKNRR